MGRNENGGTAHFIHICIYIHLAKQPLHLITYIRKEQSVVGVFCRICCFSISVCALCTHAHKRRFSLSCECICDEFIVVSVNFCADRKKSCSFLLCNRLPSNFQVHFIWLKLWGVVSVYVKWSLQSIVFCDSIFIFFNVLYMSHGYYWFQALFFVSKGTRKWIGDQ